MNSFRRRTLLTRSWAAVGLATLAAGMLTSCAPQGDDAADVTLTWWATQILPTVEENEAVYQPSIDRFTDETGIEVDLEVVPWGDLYNRILTAVTSGNGPDVISIGSSWTASIHDTGAFAELTDENLEALGGTERFVPSVFESAHVPGSVQTAVPFVSQVDSLYYNTRLFEEAGIETPPDTWSEFLADAQTLTKDLDGDGTPDQWGFGLWGASTSRNAQLAFILSSQLGGSFVNDDGEPTVDDPKVEEAVDSLVSLFSDEVVSPENAELADNAELVDRVADGEVAMVFHQNAAAQFEARGFDEWAAAPLPAFDDAVADVRSSLGGSNLVVFGESPHQTEAFQFIQHLTSVKEQGVIAAATQTLPVVSEAFSSQEIIESPFADLYTLQENILANQAAGFPLVPSIGEIETGLGGAVADSFQAYVTGKAPDVLARLTDANEKLK